MQGLHQGCISDPYSVPPQLKCSLYLNDNGFTLAPKTPQEGREHYTTESKGGSSPSDFPFCRDEQYHPAASAVVIGLKHSRTMVVPKGVVWTEYLSSWQCGGRQLMAYQNLTGNADSGRLKTTIRLKQYLSVVNRRRGWKIVLCSAPVTQRASSPTSPHTPTDSQLTPSWKGSQRKNFGLHINK